MVYLFSYDIGNDVSRSTAIRTTINANCRRALQVMSATWLLDSDLQVGALGQRIIDVAGGDRFLLTQIQNNGYFGWHSRNTWDWINEGLNRRP